MYNNALAMLVFWVRAHLPRPDLPMSFMHRQGTETWNVIVQRVPDQEQQVA